MDGNVKNTPTKGFSYCPVKLHKAIYKNFLVVFMSHFKSLFIKIQIWLVWLEIRSSVWTGDINSDNISGRERNLLLLWTVKIELNKNIWKESFVTSKFRPTVRPLKNVPCFRSSKFICDKSREKRRFPQHGWLTTCTVARCVINVRKLLRAMMDFLARISVTHKDYSHRLVWQWQRGEAQNSSSHVSPSLLWSGADALFLLTTSQKKRLPVSWKHRLEKRGVDLNHSWRRSRDVQLNLMRRKKKGHESAQLGWCVCVCVKFEVVTICVLSPTKVLRQWFHHRTIPLDDLSLLGLSWIKSIPADGARDSLRHVQSQLPVHPKCKEGLKCCSATYGTVRW